MPAGLGGGGKVGLGIETVPGTYVAPTIFVPVLNESLMYNEDKYYSEQIRQETIHSDVKSSYYHVAGTVSMEADPTNLPYWLGASRHDYATGTGTHTFTPNNAGSSEGAPYTLSITVVRNDVVFGYVGCIVGSFEFTIVDGVLQVNMDVLGIGEAVQSAPSPTWPAPDLLGADAHRVFLAASAVSPTFGAADLNFNGFTFRANFNAEPQNRIRADRQASYISFGITEAEIESELDFMDRVDYDNMVNNTTRAIRLSSTNGGATLAAATSGVEITANRVSYDAYEVGLEGMGDLIMAGFTGRVIGIAGGDAYSIAVKGPATLP